MRGDSPLPVSLARVGGPAWETQPRAARAAPPGKAPAGACTAVRLHESS